MATPIEVTTIVDFVLRSTSPITTTIVLAAVVRNFVLSQKSRPVLGRSPSVVATGSMMAFFIAVYLLIKGHAGTVPILMPHLRYALEAFGAVLMIGGCVVNVLGRYSLGQNWADQATLYSSQTLVTSGVFAITRHPLYSSLVWMFYGSALLYHNYAVTLATTFIFIPAMYYRAAIEERLLSARFDDYRSYQNRVGRLFPRLALRGGQNQ